MEKVYTDFFGKKLQCTRYQPLISWNNICTDKESDGLSLHSAENTNVALQMRLLWRILTEPNNF